MILGSCYTEFGAAGTNFDQKEIRRTAFPAGLFGGISLAFPEALSLKGPGGLQNDRRSKEAKGEPPR